ncbi:MAG TPA: hypothetical protein VIG25_16705 [Pyrinomonadaceae bacterium]
MIILATGYIMPGRTVVYDSVGKDTFASSLDSLPSELRTRDVSSTLFSA